MALAVAGQVAGQRQVAGAVGEGRQQRGEPVGVAGGQVAGGLGWVLGRTERLRAGALVTCVAYRHPGMLLKAVTTLDVLSGGRVLFGVGAGWDEEEARSLGIPFPPTGERFDRLEELLRIAKHFGPDRAAGLRQLVRRIEALAERGIGHVILVGPRFEWGDDLDAVASIVDDVHAIAAQRPRQSP